MHNELRDHRVVEHPDLRSLLEPLLEPDDRRECGGRVDDRGELVAARRGRKAVLRDGRRKDVGRLRRGEVEELPGVGEEVVARVLGIYACFEGVADEWDGGLGEGYRVS